MKIAVLCFVLIAVFHLTASTPVLNLDAQWQKYKVDFNKKYEDPAEEVRRKELFAKKLEEVEAHNAKFEKGLVSWSKGINQFSDWTTEEFQKIQGTRPV